MSDRLRQYGAVQSDVAPVSASAMAVDIRTFPWIRRLASDYAFAFEHVAPFFAGDPATSAAWADTIARSQRFTRKPAELARIIAAQQAERQAPAASRDAAARLADPATRVVITGQQAGLFGGPLFTLLKAITTMKLAAKVSGEHHVPVVPVFWIDAEDHDWPEVSGCTVLDSELAATTVRLADLPGAGAQSIARLTLNDAAVTAIDQLAAALPDTEFKTELLDHLRTAYVSGRGMATAFGVFLEQVLGPHGLVVYNSSDPAAKPLARDVFAHELRHPGETARIAARAGDALVAKMPKEEFQASHILVDDEAKAKELIAQIEKGAKFADLAKANSKDPGSAAKGGDLGWFPPEQMVKPFSEAVAALKDGEFTHAPVKSQFGWHIILRTGVRPTAPPPAFEAVKDQLSPSVEQKRVTQYVEALEKNTKVESHYQAPAPAAAPAVAPAPAPAPAPAK